LIQDAAYEALLKRQRREMHRKVAQMIAERFPEMAEAHPEVVARHWTEAGEIEPAIGAWLKAGGRRGTKRFREAEESYQRALRQLSFLPESSNRDFRELELMQSLLRSLFITRSYASPEVIRAAERRGTGR
jgi:predicted ATPase